MAQEGLQCYIKGTGCESRAEFVCHHCGVPLCGGENCCKWGWDSAFAGRIGYFLTLPPIAHHCPTHDHIRGLARLARDAVNKLNQLFPG
jgi:hypothetical protein